MQSISKVVTLMCTLQDNDFENILSKISFEPTADSFNSITNLEMKNLHKPLNPMINSGAIVAVSMIKGKTCDEKLNRVLSFLKKITNSPNIKINNNVYRSELATGSRNRSLAYYMKSTGIIKGEVEDILKVYFKLCSIEVTCKDIGRIGAVLANDGIAPWSNERIASKEVCKTVKAVMATCGMYDASGDIAVTIGIPSKSGVGGGILASVPNKMGIGVFGPSLDAKGNSIAGIQLLKDLSFNLGLSIF